MSRALFVSDIHISSPDDANYALFMRFLEKCLLIGVTDLFLLGDIFDLWISDRRYFTGRYQEVIARIRQLVACGVRIHYFEGNHDLDLRRFWQHQLGVHVYSEAAYFSLGGLRLRVEHGDQMDPSDQGYLFLRWLLRTPLLVLMQRYLPDWTVKWIGQRASRVSREYTSQVKVSTDTRACGIIRDHALRAYRQAPFDIIVSGHVHVREDATYGVESSEIRCINLGTWLKEEGRILELNGKSTRLMSVGEFLQ